jgi:hypothetical protein
VHLIKSCPCNARARSSKYCVRAERRASARRRTRLSVLNSAMFDLDDEVIVVRLQELRRGSVCGVLEWMLKMLLQRAVFTSIGRVSWRSEPGSTPTKERLKRRQTCHSRTKYLGTSWTEHPSYEPSFLGKNPQTLASLGAFICLHIYANNFYVRIIETTYISSITI